jgi:hypothetical protein
MIEEPNTRIEIYLTKQGQNNLTKRQMISLMQLLRIINTLRFQMTLLSHAVNQNDMLFRLRSEIEVCTILASSFKEAIKEFYNNKLFITLNPLSDEEETKEALAKYKIRTDNYKDDEVFRLFDYIRNNFCFHISSELFENFVNEDDAKKDILIAIAKSKKISDFCFLSVYDALILEVTGMVKNHLDQAQFADWLFKTVVEETDHFCNLLENFGGSILKKYGCQKEVNDGAIQQ